MGTKKLNASSAKPRRDMLFAARQALADAAVTTTATTPATGATDDATDTDDAPYVPQAYHDDPDELVVCPQCSKGNDSDASFCDQCGFDLTSTGFTPAEYTQHDDENVICPSCEKANDDDASFCDQCGFKLAGALGVTTSPAPGETDDESDDEGDDTDGDAPDDAAGSMALTDPAEPVTEPVDDKGNVDPNVICSNDGCNHLASGHADTADGDNTGACQMANCKCDQMGLENAVLTGNDANDTGTTTGGPDNDGGGDAATSTTNAAPFAGDDVAIPAAEPIAPAPAASVIPTLAPAGSNPPPDVDVPSGIGPSWSGVLLIEGQETEDDRGLLLDSISWETPIPLMGLASSTHDPMGFDQNAPSVWCGMVTAVERIAGESDTQLIQASGYFFSNDDGIKYSDLTLQAGRVGVSADVGVLESVDSIIDVDEWGFPLYRSYVSKGTLLGATIVPFPAFGNNTFILLGDTIETTEPVIQPDNAPVAIAASTNFIDLTDCAPCGTSSKSLSASAIPTAPPREWFDDPLFMEGDGRLLEIATGRGKAASGRYACPLTVTPEGRVFGHIAPWGVCHTGITSRCETAPHSATNYAHFKRAGQVVLCDDGTSINVGTLTYNGKHADLHLGASATMAHYDNSTTAWAHVNIGEDAHGIWVAGAVLPDVSDVDLRRIRATSPSGDWREVGGNLELVATLSVNTPGFPISLAASGRSALLAAGAYEMQATAPIEELLGELKVFQVKDEALRQYLTREFINSRNVARERVYAALRSHARQRMQKALGNKRR